MTPPPAHHIAAPRLFWRNVPLLALSQAMMLSGGSLIISTSILVGFALASDRSWATLPLAAQFIATMLTSIPAAFLMEKIGRQAGFMLATILGMIGATFAALAIYQGNFWLFMGGTILLGIFHGFGNYFRFAAADSVEMDLKGRAISYVLAGSVIAAFIGPTLAVYTRNLVPDAPFCGSYASLVGLYALALIFLGLLRLPAPPSKSPDHPQPAARPLRLIIAQPAFIVALICGMGGYGVMALVMTATPLAMQCCQFPFSDTSFVIQWHVLGMFAPSFVTGHLIRRFGLQTILLLGGLLGTLCVIINLTGSSVWHFWSALLFLGISWNFLFIGATTLLTETYQPSERTKTQAFNDFCVFTTVALSSLSAGALQHKFGWQAVNLGVVPMLLLILVSIFWLRQFKGQPHPSLSRHND